MGTLGYRATGLGERDLSMGYEFLDGLAKKAKFPFVSANTLYQKSGKPVFAPYAVFTLTQKEFKDLPVKSVKVGVTSFVRFNPTFLKAAPNGDNIIVGNPMEEAKKVIPELRSKCDFLIVLAALPKDDVHMIAKTYPGINLIFAAYGGIMTPPEEAEGDTRIAYLGNQGKQIAEIREATPARKWVSS